MTDINKNSFSLNFKPVQREAVQQQQQLNTQQQVSQTHLNNSRQAGLIPTFNPAASLGQTMLFGGKTFAKGTGSLSETVSRSVSEFEKSEDAELLLDDSKFTESTGIPAKLLNNPNFAALLDLLDE